MTACSFSLHVSDLLIPLFIFRFLNAWTMLKYPVLRKRKNNQRGQFAKIADGQRPRVRRVRRVHFTNLHSESVRGTQLQCYQTSRRRANFPYGTSARFGQSNAEATCGLALANSAFHLLKVANPDQGETREFRVFLCQFFLSQFASGTSSGGF